MGEARSYEQMFTAIEKLLETNTQESIRKAYILNKEMVSIYATTSLSKGYCYDHVNMNNLIRQIDCFPKDYHLGLLKNLRRVLSVNSIEFDKAVLDKLINHAKISKQWRNKKYFSSSFILGLLAYNTLTVIALLISSLFIMSLIFVPAIWTWAEMFDCKMLDISSNQIINAVCNLFCYLLLDIDELRVTPVNRYGILLLISFKLFNLIVIINFCCKKLLERIGEDNDT